MLVQELAVATEAARVMEEGAASGVAEGHVLPETHFLGRPRPANRGIGDNRRAKLTWVLGRIADLREVRSVSGESADVTVEFDLGQGRDPGAVVVGIDRLLQPFEVGARPGGQFREREVGNSVMGNDNYSSPGEKQSSLHTRLSSR